MKPRADSARLEVEGLGDLLVGEALEVSQDDHDPALLRQLRDGAMERPLELATFRVDLRPTALIGDSKEDLLAVARRPAISRRQPVEAEAGDDRIEPGGEPGLAAELAKAPVRAEEGFLRHLFGLGRAAEHAQGHAEDAVLVGGDELFEGPRVARPQPVQEFRIIGSISFPHG